MNHTLIVVRHFFHGFIALLRHTFGAGGDVNIFRRRRLLGAPCHKAKCKKNKDVCRYALHHYWYENTSVAVIGQWSEI